MGDRTCHNDIELRPLGDNIWMLAQGYRIFSMQLGFSMLESGNIRNINFGNIMVCARVMGDKCKLMLQVKNLVDTCLGGIIWYLWPSANQLTELTVLTRFVCGYGIFWGTDDGTGFIGTTGFGHTEPNDYAVWFFTCESRHPPLSLST